MGYWDTVGASDEWYTPKYIFDALGTEFDLDVACPKEGPLHTPVTNFFSDNALERKWNGFVWMNPPFGGRNGIEPWMEKFFEHGNGIALSPDRTSAPWFRKSWHKADYVMFLPKVRFIKPDGTLGKSPSNGTALWSIGSLANAALFEAKRKGLGVLAECL